MAETESKRWLDAGVRIAEDHKNLVLALMREMPDLTIEKALEAHVVWLGAKFMIARRELAETE
jgi:hypothetical protein